MKIFSISDIHLDYPSNKKWLLEISHHDYKDDVLILAGDITDCFDLLELCFSSLSQKFFRVLYVPGNHDLWVNRNKQKTSIEKYHDICKLSEDYGVSMHAFHINDLSIIGLHGWYDYSFGCPSKELKELWRDFYACRWPDNFSESEITRFFTNLNIKNLNIENKKIITFSHFLPRIDLMPNYIPIAHRFLYPVLGSSLIENQLRALNSSIHVYGHSHVNRNIVIDGTRYINNAFGYPHEELITQKSLLCIHET